VEEKPLLHLRHWCFFAPDPAGPGLLGATLDAPPSPLLRPWPVLWDGGLLSMPLLLPLEASARGRELEAPPTRSTNAVRETVQPVFSFMKASRASWSRPRVISGSAEGGETGSPWFLVLARFATAPCSSEGRFGMLELSGGGIVWWIRCCSVQTVVR